VIGADIGDRTNQSLTEAGKGERKRMLAILLGSPDFQQQ
jgi:hypothetical protein